MELDELTSHIRDIPDFPSPGIVFRDITPLLKNHPAFNASIDRIAEYCTSIQPDSIVAIEARGFLLAAPLAYKLDKPLIPIRKKGKLPFHTHKVEYALEYGYDTVEVHTDAITKGQRVVIVDDLLATGGTMAAAAQLVEKTGGHVSGLAVLIELTDLGGRERLNGYDIISLISY